MFNVAWPFKISMVTKLKINKHNEILLELKTTEVISFGLQGEGVGTPATSFENCDYLLS